MGRHGWVLVDDSAWGITEVDGIVGNEILNASDATLVRNGAGTAIDPFTLDVAPGQITDIELGNNAVTLPKFAAGTAAGQLMQWNGTAWVLIDDSALGITEVDGTIGNEVTNATDGTLVRAGAGTVASPYTLDVGAGQITGVELANNAVTLPKLAPGTAAGQLLQWNGTAWVLIDQTALTLTEVDGIIGNEIFNATDATLVRAGAGTAASPYTLDVGTGQITGVELANNAVTLPKLAPGTASGQLLRWNGTAWVLVDQTALTLTEVDGIIGNEILNATDATLVRAGAGTVANPYTLDVGAGQITSAELADNAVTLLKS